MVVIEEKSIEVPQEEIKRIMINNSTSRYIFKRNESEDLDTQIFSHLCS